MKPETIALFYVAFLAVLSKLIVKLKIEVIIRKMNKSDVYINKLKKTMTVSGVSTTILIAFISFLNQNITKFTGDLLIGMISVIACIGISFFIPAFTVLFEYRRYITENKKH